MCLLIGGLVKDSVVDGPGIRHVIFLQGCSRNPKCEGCHNPHLWDKKTGGLDLNLDTLSIMLTDYLDGKIGLTISGGEPLDQYENLVYVIKKLNSKRFSRNRFRKSEHHSPDVMLFTSYYFDEICSKFPDVLECVNYLVDGPYDCSLPSTHYAGSVNQRVWSKDEHKMWWLTEQTKCDIIHREEA